MSFSPAVSAWIKLRELCFLSPEGDADTRIIAPRGSSRPGWNSLVGLWCESDVMLMERSDPRRWCQLEVGIPGWSAGEDETCQGFGIDWGVAYGPFSSAD